MSFPAFTALGMQFPYGVDPEWTVIEGLLIVKAVIPDNPSPLYAFRTTPGLSLPESMGMMQAYTHDLKVQWSESGSDE